MSKFEFDFTEEQVIELLHGNNEANQWFEAMEEILPNINKVLGDPNQVILVNPESNNVIPVPTQGVGE